MDWYYSVQGQRQGPVDLEALKALIERGGLSPADHVWNAAMGSDWMPVSQVPALAGLKAESTSVQKQAELDNRMEERLAREAKTKRTQVLVLVVLVLLIGGIVGAVIFVKKNKPKWRHGISEANPIGSVAKLHQCLLEELTMDQSAGSKCYLVKMPTAELQKFSNSKNERGKHVSNAGSITLMVDGDRLVGLYAEFPSPGQHGMATIDKSIVSVFMQGYWEALGGTEEPQWRGDREKTVGLAQQYGLETLPEHGGWQIIEGKNLRAIWHLYGVDQVRTFMYITPLE